MEPGKKPRSVRVGSDKPPGEWQRIDGLLVLDKAAGVSSHRAVQEVRRLYRAAKAGHGGTLDPLATGMLPVAFGETTKFLHALLDADKGYTAQIVLGRSSTTGDAEGTLSDWVDPRPVRDAVGQALAELRASTLQVPPMYAALKQGGVALYKLARQGMQLERPARTVRIHRLDMLAMVESVVEGVPAVLLEVEVHCSKGTYLRSLAHDLGAMLGCGAYLGALRRTRVGNLGVDRMFSASHLQSLDRASRLACLLPVDHLITHLPRVDLEEDLAARFCCGQRLRVASEAVVHSGAVVHNGAELCQVRVYGVCGGGSHLLGMGMLDAAGRLVPQRLVASAAP